MYFLQPRVFLFVGWFVWQGIGIFLVFQEKKVSGLSGEDLSILSTKWTLGAFIHPAPQPGLLSSAYSSKGILAEWILRPRQFQRNPGTLGPDCGDGTSKVTLRAGQVAHTQPHWTLGHFLPGPRIF